MVVDVSALKTANEQIERDRAFLRKVIDTIPGLFFAKDRDGRFTLVNQALADLYARPMRRQHHPARNAEGGASAPVCRNLRHLLLKTESARHQRCLAREVSDGRSPA